MRILYCIPHLYNAGGMERVLTQKVNWLARHTEHKIRVITTERVPEGQRKCCFALDPRVEVTALNIDFNADYDKPLLSKWVGHMRRMRAYRKALTDYIRVHRISLCVSLGGKEIAFLRHLPCRTVAEMHFSMKQRQQLLEARHAGAFWSLLGRIRTWQLVRAVKPLERLVVLTQADKTDWQQAGCNNVTVIPNPCSLDGQKVPMEPKKKEVLAVGRLHEQKGFDMLLRAWQPIEQQHPEWSLRIVGEGPKRAELEALMRELELKHIVLAGKTDDVGIEYAAASLFVLSSRYEGLPLALIEAMWCGLPCVSFDCPQGPAELLADERGWLVPNGDTSALSAQIAYAMSHPDEASGRAGKAQAYAREAYSEAVIMPQWVEMFDGEQRSREVKK